jgi:hypothetical protein
MKRVKHSLKLVAVMALVTIGVLAGNRSYAIMYVHQCQYITCSQIQCQPGTPACNSGVWCTSGGLVQFCKCFPQNNKTCPGDDAKKYGTQGCGGNCADMGKAYCACSYPCCYNYFDGVNCVDPNLGP